MANTPNHDVYSCDCHETCSLCAEPTPINHLKPHTVKEFIFGQGIVEDTWEMVCPECRGENP
jgi:hypothetical protein